MNVQVCRSSAGLVPWSASRGLYLRPCALLSIRVVLPADKEKGKSKGENASAVSSWEAAERVREAARPDSFAVLKVVADGGGADGLRLDGEIEDRSRLEALVERLNRASIRLRGFARALRLRAEERPGGAPRRHDWDAHFRDAPDMDEMKPGERPDTLKLVDLPTEWFADAASNPDEPSERLLKELFSEFGEVRAVDVPRLDPHRARMNERISGITKFSFDSELRFEAYVQYREYAGFARAMDKLGGRRLVKKCADGVTRFAAIGVDFDRTKHLSDASVRRRAIVRERLVARERAKEAADKQATDAERRRKTLTEKEKVSRTEERERRRKERQLAKLKEQESSELNSKIERETKKLLKTQRKLQSIRLIEELFTRLDVKHKSGKLKRKDIVEDVYSAKRENSKKEIKELEKALLNEKSGRDKLVRKYKNAQEQELEDQRIQLQNVLEGRAVLRSVLETGNRKRASSLSSLSSTSDKSNDNRRDIKNEATKSPQRKVPAMHNEIQGPGLGAEYPYAMYNPYAAYNYPPIPNPPFPNGEFYDGGFSGRGRMARRRSRGGIFPRGSRGMPRIPYYENSEASRLYYRYFKSLTEDNRYTSSKRRSHSRNRSPRRHSRSRSSSYRSRRRSRSRSRSRSRRYTRSRSRSYSRSRSSTRSRSRGRRSRRSKSSHYKRSRRSRSKSSKKSPADSRRTNSRSEKVLKSKSRSRSPSRKRSAEKRNNSKSRKESKDRSKDESSTPKEAKTSSVNEGGSKNDS